MKSEHRNEVEFKKEVGILSTKWGEYQQLKEYYEQHQDCNVPTRYENKPQLGNWVNDQRQAYKKNKLSQERINLLNQLNFNWDGAEGKWREMYQQLKEYYEQHQDCNVPQRYEHNSSLGVWVKAQRQAYRKNELSQEKIDLLEKINFSWDVLESRWQEMYQQLKEYYNQHQHCNVPTRYKGNPQLRYWVDYQRQAYKKNKLSQERIDLLNQLNFDWRS